jgi:hypothetical protein
MKNTYKLILVLILIISFGYSCNRYAAPGSRAEIEDRRTTKEVYYNPTGFQGDNDVITSDVPAADDTLREESDQISFPEYIDADSGKSALFSVQVFASKSSGEANNFQNEIQLQFEENVRTDYVPPYYKVRIGEKASLEEGEALLDKVKAMGYRNAWLVRISN